MGVTICFAIFVVSLIGGILLLAFSPIFGWNPLLLLIVFISLIVTEVVISILVAWVSEHRVNDTDDLTDEELAKIIKEERAHDNILNHVK